MSGPKDGRGRDAFDDFFGDPSPSGRMGAASQRPTDAGGESTQDVGLDRGAGTASDQPAAAPEPTQSATGAVPEDWWTSEPDHSPAASGSAWAASPAPQSAPGGQPPRRGLSPFALVAMLVGAVLVGGLCVGGTVMALNEDDEPVASHTTVTQTSSETSSPEESSSDEDDAASSSDESDSESDSESESSTESDSESDSETESSTEEPTTESSTEPSSSSSSSEPSSESSTESSSSSSSSSTTMARSGETPAGVTSCAGPSSGVSVGRGTDVTSCEFAVAVRDAYVAQNTEGAASLEVRSPVTDESYSMSCSGQGVTRCTGGNNAVVVLY